MWATVLVLALMTATEPVRLGIAICLISGPRPVINLAAFWLGGMATGISAALGVLVLLRDCASGIMQDAASAAASLVASSAVRHVQVAAGVLALLIAALIALRFSARQRAPVAGGAPGALPSPSAFSRLFARAHSTLEGGFPWVALAVGISSAGPPPVEYLVALTAIIASGAAIGTQLSAAVAYVVVMLAIVEIPLVGYLATPAKTQAVMLKLGDWLRARRRQILAAVLAVLGVVLVATGMGSYA